MNAHFISKYLHALRHPFGYHCSHVIKLLFDYVEGALDPATAVKLEKHLSDCPECVRFVESYRSTKTACREHGKLQREMPPELRDKLIQFIRKDLQPHQ